MGRKQKIAGILAGSLILTFGVWSRPEPVQEADPFQVYQAEVAEELLAETPDEETAQLPLVKMIHDIAFADAQTGYVSMDSGNLCYILAFTDDGGQHWEQRHCGELIQNLAFIDAEHGYGTVYDAAAGLSTGKLARTDDGGRTWQLINAFQNESLAVVAGIVPGGTVFVSCDEGRHLYYTCDDFMTRKEIPLPTWEAGVRSVFYWSSDTCGWALMGSQGGTGNQEKRLFQTEDSGQSWTLRATSAEFGDIGHYQEGIPMGGYISSLTGLQDGTVFIGMTRGDVQQLNPGSSQTRRMLSDTAYSDWSPAPEFVSLTEGYAIMDYSNLMHTTDKGKTWTQVMLPELAQKP